VWVLNPEWEKATHRIFFSGLQSWEGFVAEELNPSSSQVPSCPPIRKCLPLSPESPAP